MTSTKYFARFYRWVKYVPGETGGGQSSGGHLTTASDAARPDTSARTKLGCELAGQYDETGPATAKATMSPQVPDLQTAVLGTNPRQRRPSRQ